MHCAPFAIYFNLINNYSAAGAPGHHGAKGRCIWYTGVVWIRFVGRMFRSKFFEVVLIGEIFFVWKIAGYTIAIHRLSRWYWNARTAWKRRTDWTTWTKRVSIRYVIAIIRIFIQNFSFATCPETFVHVALPQNARIAR